MASEGAGAVGPTLGEMDLDEFRRAGHRIVDWIADYRAHPECYPVLSRCRPGELRAQLPRAAPFALLIDQCKCGTPLEIKAAFHELQAALNAQLAAVTTIIATLP